MDFLGNHNPSDSCDPASWERAGRGTEVSTSSQTTEMYGCKRHGSRTAFCCRYTNVTHSLRTLLYYCNRITLNSKKFQKIISELLHKVLCICYHIFLLSYVKIQISKSRQITLMGKVARTKNNGNST